MVYEVAAFGPVQAHFTAVCNDPHHTTSHVPTNLQKWGAAYPERLLEVLRHTMSRALLELARAFPAGDALDRGEQWMPTAALLQFARSVEKLGEAPGGTSTDGSVHSAAWGPAASHARSYVQRHDSKPLMHVTRYLGTLYIVDQLHSTQTGSSRCQGLQAGSQAVQHRRWCSHQQRTARQRRL